MITDRADIRWKGKREKFAADHDSDIRRYHLSKRKLKELLGEEPVTIKVWQDKLARIQQERSDLYLEYAPPFPMLKDTGINYSILPMKR